MKLIVSDTTSLIVLESLGALDLVCSLFGGVILPSAVVAELEAGSPDIKQKLEKAGCFECVELEASDRLSSLDLILDRGEAEAITLAVERDLPILIDEKKRSFNRATAKPHYYRLCRHINFGGEKKRTFFGGSASYVRPSN